MDPSSAPWRALEPSEPGPAAPEPEPRAIPWLAVAIILAVAAAAVGAFLIASRPEAVITVDGATSHAASASGGGLDRSSGAPQGEVVVEVGGAVAHPGVYRLPTGARIGDAIAAAGGYGPRVDAAAADARLNLAALVHDGDEIHVPARDELAAASGGVTVPSGGGGAGLVDLNTATAEQLDTLPGVGPATAAKIIAAREERRFASVDELGSRGVVGAATLAKIRPLATAGP